MTFRRAAPISFAQPRRPSPGTKPRTRFSLIATGSHPIHPPNLPFDDPGVDDSEGILKLDRLPRSLRAKGKEIDRVMKTT